MEREEELRAAQALAVHRIGEELAHVKGAMAAMTIVTAHLLAHASEEAQTEARVALRLQHQNLGPVSPSMRAGFEEAMASHRA